MKTKTAPVVLGAVLSGGSIKKTPSGVLPQLLSLVVAVLSILSLTYTESCVNTKTVPISSQNSLNVVIRYNKFRKKKRDMVCRSLVE